MKPTTEPISKADNGLLQRLAKLLSLGQTLAALCAERARYRTRQEPPTAMYPQIRFSTEGRGVSPCR